MSAYLDASVLVALFTDDHFSAQADRIFRGRAVPAIVSDFAAAEFASSIARHVRMARLNLRSARSVLADFDAWMARMTSRVDLSPGDVRTAEAILRRLDLTLRTPDALHIAVAQRIGAELATFDTRLAENARALGVTLAPV